VSGGERQQRLGEFSHRPIRTGGAVKKFGEPDYDDVQPFPTAEQAEVLLRGRRAAG